MIKTIQQIIFFTIILNITNPAFAAKPSSLIEYFSISTPTTGSTCGLPQTSASIISPTITIAAYDKTNKLLTTYKDSIDLTTSSGRGTWTISNAKGTLIQGAPNSGQASYIFHPTDNGSISLYLTNTSSDNLTITAYDVTNDVTNTSATIQYQNNEYVITSDPITIAGKPNNITVSMYKKDTVAGFCGIATEYNGIKSTKVWISRDINDPNGILPKINGVTIPTSTPVTNNLNLTFTNGVSLFNLTTTDVGKYSLNIRDGSGFSNAINIDGVTPTLTFKPFGIILSNILCGTTLNPASTSSTGGLFCKAGQSFSATATSHLWNSTSDANNDGVPDSGKTTSQLTSGGVTPAFKWNTTLATAAPFYPSTPLDLPAGTGTAGSIGNPIINAAIYSNGIANATNLSYSEVGSFTLTGTSLNYLNTSGANIPIMNPTTVGRFTPNHFKTSGGSIINRTNEFCSTNSSFSYMGEKVRSAIIITAENASNITTKNYTGGYAKFNPSLSNNWNIQSKNTSTNLTSRMIYSTAIGNFSNGIYNGYIDYSFLRNNNPDGPFSTLQIGISPLDSDNVKTTSLDIDIDGVVGNDAYRLGTTDLRFGRLTLMNNYGSDLLPLQIPLKTEYYNGTAFTTNTLDNCTTTSSTMFATSNFSQNLQSSEISFIYSGTPFVNGISSVTATKPSGGDGLYDGSFDIQYKLDSDSKTYLQGKWTGASATYSENPKAKITFAKQKNKSTKVLYLKELY